MTLEAGQVAEQTAACVPAPPCETRNLVAPGGGGGGEAATRLKNNCTSLLLLFPPRKAQSSHL